MNRSVNILCRETYIIMKNKIYKQIAQPLRKIILISQLMKKEEFHLDAWLKLKMTVITTTTATAIIILFTNITKLYSHKVILNKIALIPLRNRSKQQQKQVIYKI